MVTRKMRKVVQFVLIVIITSYRYCTAVHLCPEWCECTAVNEIRFGSSEISQEMKVSCEWSKIPQEMQRLQALMPPDIVARLMIKCKDLSTPFEFTRSTFIRFEKLRHLSIINCKLNEKSFQPGNLLSLKTLHLENLSLSPTTGDFIINDKTFSSLKSLEKLSIISSNLKSIPGGELCSLKELKSINFSDNHLLSIADVGFGGCQNQLVILDLDKNQISTINETALGDFSSLRILRLNNNELQFIATNTFQRTRQMRHLHMSNNQISTVDDLPAHLHNLDLSYNNLHMIPPAIIVHDFVTYLNLSHNFIDINTPFVFKSTNQLTVLDMSYNNLETVPVNFFQKNSTNALTELLFNNNDMRSLQLATFENLHNLRRLNLGQNKLTALNTAHFKGVEQLEELSLESNALSKFENNLFQLNPNLLKLILAGNIFIEAPKALLTLTKLIDLDMSRNSISSIPEHLFSSLTQLNILNLSSNRLTTIERNCLEKMSKLKTLDLSDNAIERIVTNSLDGNNELTEINLNNNLLKDVNGAFANLQRLQTLNLSHNRIKHFDFTLLPYNLKGLMVHHNNITQITNFLPAIRTLDLRYIDFSSNKLEKLTSSMLPSSLEKANFSRNEISKLDKEVLQDKINLTSLDLSYNRIRVINQLSLIVKSANKNRQYEVHLKENPFQCTCEMYWMKSAYAGGSNEALYVGVPTITDFNQLKCNSIQREDEFRPINNISSNEFLCTYTKMCSEECNCCEFEFCDCKNVCPDGCTCLVDATSAINTVECTNAFHSHAVTEKQVHSIPMYATVIRLDGVILPHLNRNAFFGRFRLKQLYLNHSGVENISSKAFNGLTSLEMLDLSDNSLQTLTGHEFYNTPKMETLFLNGNKLTTLEGTGFVNLPNLKYLTLHNNKFKTLPYALIDADNWLQGLTLSNNPFKCDCDDKYLIQTWLPDHVNLVTDNKAIYCFENLTENSNKSTNSSTILSVLPPTSITDNVVKVNFWTFVGKINQTFCYPKRKEYELEDPDKEDDQQEFDKMLLLIPVVLCSIFLLAILAILLLWRYRKRLGKKFYDKYRTNNDSSSHQSTTGSSLRSSNTGPTTPTPPLLQYDAFISYSKLDAEFVEREIAPQLEHVQPYYKLCLLHKEFPTNPDCPDRQYVQDELIRAMSQSQRLITVVSANFLNNEWDLLHIRTAYRMALKNKHRQSLVTILLENELPKSKDDMLGHYIRISQCYKWTDKQFWENFLQAMPDESSNTYHTGSSSHYSDIGGFGGTSNTTIVPSQFV